MAARTEGARSRRTMLTILAMLAAIIVAVPFAFAADEVGFELDTDTDHDGGNDAIDWEDFIGAPGSTADAVLDTSNFPLVGTGADGSISLSAAGLDVDHQLPDLTTYTTGSKDTLDISTGWECSQSNNVGDKVDLLNVYSAAGYDNGDLHLFFGAERSSNNGDANIAVWFLLDEEVGCEATGPGGGGKQPFTGNHENGDILLVSAFTNGGTQANVTAYIWDNGSLTPFATGAECQPGTQANENLCAVANDDPVDTPWFSPTSDNKDTDVLAANQFYEGGINLSAALDQAVDDGIIGQVPGDLCFGTFVANTRSSTSLTATLFDFASSSLPVCGGLEVDKYIDVNEDGGTDGEPDTGDLTSQAAIQAALTGDVDEFGADTDLAGWSIDVLAPDGTTVICTGTTDVNGNVTCAEGGDALDNLAPGTYFVRENGPIASGWQNTDPGTVGTLKSVEVGLGGDTQAWIGNTCLVAVAFEVTGIPTDVTAPQSMTVDWEVTSGPNIGDMGTESMTIDGSTATATTSNQFSIADTVKWDFYINGDESAIRTGNSGVALSGEAYPDCLADSTQAYPNVDLLGFKYKDMNDNGTHDSGEPGLGGWTFKLFPSGADTGNDTPLQTAVSSSDLATLGDYTFTDVAPGSYVVVEELITSDWVQSGPLDINDTVVTEIAVTVPFDGDSDVSIDDIGNTPLSRVKVEFEDLTGSTDATIDCDWSEGTEVDSETEDPGETVSEERSDLRIGEYECTVVITDP